MYKVCVDTGGTFTDCVVLDDRGYKKEYKAPRTPAACFKNGFVESSCHPTGAKARYFPAFFGPAEAVPLLQN